MGRSAEMWQEQQEMEQAHQEWEQQHKDDCCCDDCEEHMEPHKRTGYFEMMCDMADHQRKWLRENGK